MYPFSRQLLGLIAVSGLLFFANLGAAGLWDEDEPIFAGAAREMMARREWVVPYFNSAMLSDKPALVYWVMIAAYQLFGPTEFAARAGSALFSIGTVLLTAWLGRRMFSSRAGFWAGLALATSLSFDVVARAATPDALLTFFMTLALVFYAAGTNCLTGASADDGAARPRRTRWPALAASYAAMGVAVLAKGPIGVFLPVAAIGLFSLLSSAEAAPDAASPGRLAAARRKMVAAWRIFHPRRLLAALFEMRPLMGIALVLAIAGPWYAAVGLRTDGQWLAGFFGKHNLGRFLHPMEHHRGPLFYYLAAIVIGFFPWSVFLGPIAIYVKGWLAAARPGRERYVFLTCWLAAYVGFFSLAATKLPNYIVPAYPALALLAGAWMEAWLDGREQSPRLLGVAWATLALVGIGLTAALPLLAQRLLGGEPLLALTGLPLIMGAAFCWHWFRRAEPRRAATAFAVTAVAFTLAVFAGGAVRIGRHQTSALFAEVIHQQVGSGPAVVRTFGYWRPSLVYYLQRPVQQFFSDEQVFALCREWPYHGFLLTTSDRYPKLAALLPADVVVLARERWFLRSPDLLLLGRATPHTHSERLAWRDSSKR